MNIPFDITRYRKLLFIWQCTLSVERNYVTLFHSSPHNCHMIIIMIFYIQMYHKTPLKDKLDIIPKDIVLSCDMVNHFLCVHLLCRYCRIEIKFIMSIMWNSHSCWLDSSRITKHSFYKFRLVYLSIFIHTLRLSARL